METTEDLQWQYVLAKRRVRRDILSTRAIEASLLAQQTAVIPPPSLLFSTTVQDHLQALLGQFKYQDILKELLDISPKAARSMSLELFTEIARAVSQHRIDVVSAAQLFHVEEGELRWERLARRTVHKMRLLFLTEKLYSSGLLAMPSYRNRQATSRTFVRDTSPKKTPTKLSSLARTAAGPRKPSTKRSPKSEYLHSLTVGLERSSAALRSIAGGQSDIMVLSAQTVGVAQFSAAAAFSRNVAVRRMQTLCRSRARRLLSEAWAVLRTHCKLVEVLSIVVVPAVKALAAERLCELLLRCRRRSSHKALLRLWSWVRVCRFGEYSAAAVELQRAYRGFLCRLELKTRRLTTQTENILRVNRLSAVLRKMCFLWRAKQSIRQIAAWFRRRKKLRLFYRRLFRRKCVYSAVAIQRLFRGSRSRRRTKPLFYEVRVRVTSAVRIQSWARGRKQRHLFRKLRKSATIIQRAWSMHVHRQRLAFKRIEAAFNLSREIAKKNLILRGEQLIKAAAARKITSKLRECAAKKSLQFPVEDPESWFLAHKQRFLRCLAAVRLRRLLANLWLRRKQRRDAAIIRRDFMHLRRKRAHAALEIQRVYRGSQGRTLAARLRKNYDADIERRYHGVPFYYRMQQSYLQTQNMMHRREVVRIQSAYRTHLAKKLRRAYKRSAAAEVIALKFREHQRVLDAKIILSHKRAAYLHMVSQATTIQKVVRSWIARKVKTRLEAAKMILRFSLCNSLARRIFTILKKHKFGLLQQIRFLESVVKIQSMGRRYLARVKYLKSYRKLAKATANREKARRTRASVKIQAMIRCFLAKVRVKKRRAAHSLEQKKVADETALEADLDAMHDRFLVDLQVVKVQQHVRKHQSAKFV